MGSETQEGSTASGGPNLLIPGAIILAGVIVAAAVLYMGGLGNQDRSGRQSTTGSASPTASEGSAPSDLADDDPSLGNPSAPVTFVEFGDFQCPFCGRFFIETEPRIIEKYVKTGKVRFVYRDLAFLGEESVLAAEAAECADEQGKFWPYHDKLYRHIWDNFYAQSKNGENVGAFSNDNLNRFSRELNLDTVRFSQCLSSHRYKSEVEKDTADARAAGASGTPANFINGRIVVGALPFSQFESLIEAALAESSR